MNTIKRFFGWVAGLFPSFEPLIAEPKMGPERILSSLNTIPKDYLDPDIMYAHAKAKTEDREIAQAVIDNNTSVLLGYVGSSREVTLPRFLDSCR